MRRESLRIPEVRLESAGPDRWRIAASIAGTDIFFEASVPLSPRPETLVCPLLFPAMSMHANLAVSGAVDARFLENLAFVQRRATEWWSEFSAGDVHAPVAAVCPPGPDAGLFYTGGVDSSYALQQLRDRIRYAIFVEGFDIPLTDADRLRKAREWLSATTRACGVELIVVRTNLREHPTFREVFWETTHVAALAGVAHALGNLVHTVYVAASDLPPPHGSAPDLDGAWSSGSLKTENFGAELNRLQRVASIAKWEPLRGRLRVCWENNASELNCGYCEKCTRTRMQLLVSGAPDGLDSFPREPSLPSALRELHAVKKGLHGHWREIAARLGDDHLRNEIDRFAPRRDGDTG